MLLKVYLSNSRNVAEYFNFECWHAMSKIQKYVLKYSARPPKHYVVNIKHIILKIEMTSKWDQKLQYV